jgi:hypothetical protein
MTAMAWKGHAALEFTSIVLNGTDRFRLDLRGFGKDWKGLGGTDRIGQDWHGLERTGRFRKD